MRTSELIRLGLLILSTSVSANAANATTIVCPRDASPLVALAAREVRRYVYVRTGELLPIAKSGNGIVLHVDKKLEAQQYQLKTKGDRLTITGGSDLAVLYGAYDMAEKLGVRFYLHGDVIPDGKVAFALPQLDEAHRPLFALRGIQPFHDFPEGPDWWNADDYKAHCTQMTKMRMNFIGLHCYPLYRPWVHVNPEPTVWIGQPSDVDKDGRVKFSYPASWANTARLGSGGPVSWGFVPAKTSEFRFGAAELFDRDAYGADVMTGLTPWPQTPEQCNNLFNRAGAMFQDVFGFARMLGVKSCIGIETPFWIPDEVRTRLKSSGKDPDDPATVRELYRGIYQRILKSHPLDYFWIWTPERELDVAKTKADLQTAYDVAKEMKVPFDVAACGWGWIAHKFEPFDKALPKEIIFSCISDQMGFQAMTTNFARLKVREHWAIPWMEDDWAMTMPQLWVGRIRKDAVDARRYGCNGLMGIHWRTRVIAPSLAALAQAGWSQDGWSDGTLADLGPVIAGKPDRFKARMLPALDFYRDWCRAQFGESVAEAAAGIFAAQDGKLPRRHVRWEASGPGAVGEPDARQWDEVKKEYGFVDELAALRPKISGAGNLERFDYWCDQFRFMRAMAKVCCTMPKPDHHEQLVCDWTEMMTFLLQTVSTPGELGTVANLEQHSRLGLKVFVGRDAELPAIYEGKPRLVVPTVRSLAIKAESLKLEIIALDKQRVADVAVHIRPLGMGKWKTTPASHLARARHRAVLPAAKDDFEYYVTAVTAGGEKLVWPATAPQLNQTVVVTQAER